jgi:hypothetical protein
MQQWEVKQLEKKLAEEERLKMQEKEKQKLLREKYKELLSKWQVRKVHKIEEIDTSICCYACNEIISNSLEVCPVCETESSEIDESSNLVESGWEVITIQCLECNSYFKLVAGKWYGWNEGDEPKIVQISKEEAEAENGIRDKVDKANYYDFVSQLKIGE